MKKIINTLFFSVLFLGFYTSSAQSEKWQSALQNGDAMYESYRFKEAAAIYNAQLKETTDTTLRADIARRITLCENGNQMLQFSLIPNVIGKSAVPLAFFYIYYDVDISGFWAATPAPLVSDNQSLVPQNRRAALNETIPPFVFTRSATPDVLYFSSRSADGNTGWDIYETHRLPNNEWSVPERLSETINTPFDERFPYVTPDGKTLYFSSTGHYGMGGYDLYKSTLNPATNEWNAPENLGFPFSSIGHDLLYVPDADGLYACFASTRHTHRDSVTLYKIALEGTPVKHAVTAMSDILQLESLAPTRHDAAAKPDVATNGIHVRYNALLGKVRQISEKITDVQQALNRLRIDYAAAQSVEQQRIAAQITTHEQTLVQYQEEFRKANDNVQQAEYEMLAQGIVPTADIAPPSAAPNQAQPMQASFMPKYNSMITLPDITLQQPVVQAEETDFTFRTNAATEMFTHAAAEGIRYSIRFGVFSRRLSAKECKGFTPVFETALGDKWAYSIGSFSLFNEAQKQLPAVRRSFSDALIVAFKNGKTIPVKQARLEEGKTPAQPAKADVAYQIVLGDYPAGLPKNLLKTVQQATNKDIVRTTHNGKTGYAVGAYAHKSEADKVLDILHRNGFDKTRIEAVEKK
ncbi:MAG: hypothetical protein LBT48_09130 [Prevotellaceae bacterium]|jgi:hypothetical protein|nr:hypothetical protein [Prevotellaceae bacterium]